jgi:hypothetical protein
MMLLLKAPPIASCMSISNGNFAPPKKWQQEQTPIIIEDYK